MQKTAVVDYTLRLDDHHTNPLEMLRQQFHCPCYVSSRRVKSGRIELQVWRTEDSGKFLFRFYDGVEFLIDREHADIWIGCRGASLQAATDHLLFSLPGFLLGLRKSACLHGAAIARRDGAVALVGESNSGKSLLSAIMAERGVDILSDDLIALDVIGDTAHVYPGYPWICLRPGSLHWLGPDFDLGRIGSRWRYFDQAWVTWDLRRTGALSSKLRKLEVVYLLMPTDDTTCKLAIEEIPQQQALMALMEAADRTHIPCPDFRRQEFSLIGLVVAAVPIYTLRYHPSADSLSALSLFLQQSPELWQYQD
jgi:hypothetical protein